MLSDTHRERVARVRQIILDAGEDQFDMSNWFDIPGVYVASASRHTDIFADHFSDVVNTCGTTACLAGWAALTRVAEIDPATDEIPQWTPNEMAVWLGMPWRHNTTTHPAQQTALMPMFFVDSWPDDLQAQLAHVEDDEDYRHRQYEVIMQFLFELIDGERTWPQPGDNEVLDFDWHGLS